MLSYRKDHSTGGKYVLYWNKRSINKDQHDKYWMAEVNRLKAELKETKEVNQTMLKLADAMISSHRRPI